MQKLALLHLSDIHFKATKNAIASRAGDIANVVSSFSHEVEKVLIIISGDVAFSGAPEEYALAEQFVAALLEALAKTSVAAVKDIIVVPGNHDCDLSQPNSIREMFLSNTKKNRELLGPDLLEACVKVQSNYRSFLQRIQPHRTDNDSRALFYSNVVAIEDRRLLINTCRRHYQPQSRGRAFPGVHRIPSAGVWARAAR